MENKAIKQSASTTMEKKVIVVGTMAKELEARWPKAKDVEFYRCKRLKVRNGVRDMCTKVKSEARKRIEKSLRLT